jgi:hypothetical protein
MNMISTGTFCDEMDASNKADTIVSKLVNAWEKKNAKVARAGGVSLMALSLAACGSSDSTTTTTDTTTDTTTTTTTTDTVVRESFKTGLDDISGGNADDSFSGSNTTLNSGDLLDGGAGADTLAVFSAVVATVGGFVSSNVETISASSTSSTATDILTVNLGMVSGESTLQVTGSSSSVTFNNTDNIADLVLSYNSGGNIVVTMNASTVVGTADSMSVSTTDTTNGTLNVAGIETLTITNSGTSTLDVLTAAAATTLNMAGSGKLTVTDAADTLTTISSATSTGANIVDGVGATDLTFTGGSGADTLKMGITLTKADTIDGGAGDDVLVVNNTGGAALAVMPASASVSNVETLRIEATDDSGADAFTYNASVVDFTNVIIDASDQADTYTFTNITDEVITVTESANNAVALLDMSIASPLGASDSLTLNVTNADAATALTISDINSSGGGIETLNLVLNQGKDISGGSDIIIADVSSTHSGGVVITGAADATVGSGTAFANKSLDASAGTGDYTITVGAATSTIKTNSGTDTITFAANALTSLDTVNAGTGTDTLVTGALAAGTAAPTLTGVETIKANFANSASVSLLNAATGVTKLTAQGDENHSFTNIPATVATIQLASTDADGGETVTLAHTGSAAALTLTIGDVVDGTANADVDLDATSSTYAGAMTLLSDGANTNTNTFNGFDANSATSLTIQTDNDLSVTGGGDDDISATKATAVTITTNGGSLVIDDDLIINKSAQTTITASSGAVTITGDLDNSADGSVTLVANGSDTSDIIIDNSMAMENLVTLDATASNGADIRIDQISAFTGTTSTAAALSTAINLTATGSGSTSTLAAMSVGTVTLDSVTLTTSDSGAVSFTASDTSLTITSIDASASAATLTGATTNALTIDVTALAAATTITLGAGDATVTTSNNGDTVTSGGGDTNYTITDGLTTITLGAGVDKMTFVQDDASVVYGFTVASDIIVLDESVIEAHDGGTALVNGNGDNATALTAVVIDDVTSTADYTMDVASSVLRLSGSFADVAAVKANIAGAAGKMQDSNMADADTFMLIWSDGANTHISAVEVDDVDDGISNFAEVDVAIVSDIAVLMGVSHTTLTAANFGGAFIA